VKILEVFTVPSSFNLNISLGIVSTILTAKPSDSLYSISISTTPSFDFISKVLGLL